MDEVLSEDISSLSGNHTFVREFIASYKQLPLLWNMSHPLYRKRDERVKALQKLVLMVKAFHPGADQYYVRTKIDSLRCSFRKERRKFLSSKVHESDPRFYYKPTLWYYDLLLFTTGEEEVVDNKDNIVNFVETQEDLEISPSWSRDTYKLLIELYRKHACLYKNKSSIYNMRKQRKVAIMNITRTLSSFGGKQFKCEEVRQKINHIRTRFLFEYKKTIRLQNQAYVPRLWYYNMLDFLMPQYTNNKEITQNPQSNDKSADIFDATAKHIAHKLRDMDEQQRQIATRILREVLYHGQMENLTSNSTLCLNNET